MAGQAGKSGGYNRTLSPRIGLEQADNPRDKALVKPGWWSSREPQSREEIFDKLAEKLHALGLTDQTDSPVVAMLAVQYKILLDSQAIYDEGGPTALIGRALASRVITEASREIRVLLGEWNLIPSTRSKRPDQSKAESGIDNLLNFKH